MDYTPQRRRSLLTDSGKCCSGWVRWQLRPPGPRSSRGRSRTRVSRPEVSTAARLTLAAFKALYGIDRIVKLFNKVLQKTPSGTSLAAFTAPYGLAHVPVAQIFISQQRFWQHLASLGIFRLFAPLYF